MHRLMALLALLIMASMPCLADDPFGDPVFQPKPNDYVIYRDTRGGGERFIGYMFKGDDTYICRSYDAVTGDELEVSFVCQERGDEIVTRDMKALKGTLVPARLAELLMDFMWLLGRDEDVDRSAFPETVVERDTVGQGPEAEQRVVVYRFWVPVFNLFEMRTVGLDGAFALLEFGKDQKRESSRFHAYRSMPRIVEGPSYSIPPKGPVHLGFDFVDIDLDDNWKVEGNEAILSVATPRDALVSFKNYPFDLSKDPDLGFISYAVAYGDLHGLGMPVLADTVRFQSGDGALVVSYYAYNPRDRMVTRIVHAFRYEDAMLVELTLYSYASLYVANQAYFDSIVQSVVDSGREP